MRNRYILLAILLLKSSLFYGQTEDWTKAKKRDYLKKLDWQDLGRRTIDQESDTFHLILKLATELNDDYSKSLALHNLGWVFIRTGEYEKSINHFKKAHGISQGNKWYLRAAEDKYGISNVLYVRDEFKKSNEYLVSMIDVLKDSADFDMQFNTYTSIARNYILLKEYDTALEWAELGEEQLEFIKFEDSYYKNYYISNLRQIRSKIYVVKHKYKEALPLLIEEHKFCLEDGIIAPIINSYLGLSEVYSKLGYIDESIYNVNQAYAYTDSVPDGLVAKRDVIKFKSNVFEEAKMYDSSLVYFRKYMKLSDSVNDITNESNMNELLVKFEVSELENLALKQEHNIETLKLLNEKERVAKRWSIAFGITLFVLSTIVIFALIRGFRRKKQLDAYEKQLLKSELDKKEIEEQHLKNEVEIKKTELTNFALEIARKNELSKDMLGRLKKVIGSKRVVDDLKELVFYIHSNLEINKSYEELQDSVDHMNMQFFSNLKKKFPKCTKNDAKLAALIRLGLTSKEIADIKNIEITSVEIARHRLRKKMNLDKSVNLTMFLEGF